MRIAVTYEEESGQIYPHFGHTEKFKLYDTENGKIVSSTVIPTAGTGHSALAQFLIGQGVDAVICGGIGFGMQEALMRESLLVYGGVKGSADDAVQAFLEKRLEFAPHPECAGHEEGEGCGCGHHHEHAESSCGCGHHHAHQESGCGCGHHHAHQEGDCGCGHHHGAEA
ncbi:MAG: NifB/NifX family molybdenum-iron cluster-binding protein [Oscillospiraceae bacterium]|jgi:predicted Fe-Mo cluster-binding NifX family protein